MSTSVIDPAIRSVLQVFEGPLADVAFPEIDGESLAEQAAGVEAGAAEVARARDRLLAAQAALTAAEQTLAERERNLQDRARRALAYARVYASGDADLSSELEAIVLPVGWGEAAASPLAKKRGRPRKATAATASPSQSALEGPDPCEVPAVALAAVEMAAVEVGEVEVGEVEVGEVETTTEGPTAPVSATRASSAGSSGARSGRSPEAVALAAAG